MKVNVRMSGSLAHKVGVPRLAVDLRSPAQVFDLLSSLTEKYPQIADELEFVVVVVGGTIQPRTADLKDGQEVALLLPVAGG